MEWDDQGILLATRPHGEGAVVATLLTRNHGRHSGLVAGARSSRLRGALEPGSVLSARWRGRLAEHLGHFTLEPVKGYAALFFDAAARLAALSSACALVDSALADHEPHPALYDGLLALFDLLDGPVWAESYVRWEVGLLAELGFGLDLDRCAVSGANDYLAYVSPRTGRAVTASVGEPYRDRLLPLPDFLAGRGGGGPVEVMSGLRLTGHFLERSLLNGSLPPACVRLRERYANAVARGDQIG
jgi:DNA repair protein RecO (recombination protein O)